MTISTTSSVTVALGNNVTTQFSFSFVGVSTDDIQVTYTDTTGTATVLPSIVYSITLNAPGVGQLWGIGGTVTYPLTGTPIASGTSLTIERILPLVQLTSISNQGDFYPNAVEQALDYLTMITQQLSQVNGSAIQAPPSDPSGLNYVLPAVAQRAGQLVSFDSSGNVIVAQPTGALVSAAMQPVVNAATILAADILLGPGMITYLQSQGYLTAASPPRGFVNRLRNSTFVSWPNGISGTIPTSGSGTTIITANGWVAQATGAAGTWAQQPVGQNGTYYSLKLEGATSNTDISASQRIGGSDGAVLAGQTCTFQCAVFNNTGAALVPILSTAYATAFENFTSTTTDLAAVNLQSIANGTWGTIAYTFNVSANADNGYQIKLDFGALNANTKYIYITACDLRIAPGVTLGLNSSPSTPELADLVTEIDRNAAYFQTSYNNGLSPGTVTPNGAVFIYVSGGSNGQYGATVPLPIRMRANPTIVVYGPIGGVSGVAWDYASGVQVTVTTVDAGMSGFFWTATAFSGNQINLGIHWTAYADFW